MSFTGDLKKLPLADVFQSIHQNSLTGALAIRDARGERLVAFKDGFVSGCAAPQGEEHGIADELVRRKVIDEKDARPSRFFRRKGSLKSSLKKKNVLDSGEFTSLTRSLVLERVYDCFLLEEGKFEFLEVYDASRFDDDELAAELRIAPAEILMEAMRRIDEFKRIRRSIPSFREVYAATRGPTEEDTPLDRSILELTSAGTLQLQAVLDEVPKPRFQVAEAVMALVARGDLRVATAPEYLELGKAAEERGDLDKAASHYARGLAYERGNEELNQRRIAVLERLKRNAEAADERKVYAGVLLEHQKRAQALEQFARAAELVPGDPLPLERLLDLRVEDKDLARAREAGDQLVRVYLQLGLSEKAKGVVPRLLVLAPRDRGLRERLAEVHAALNEAATAATIWKELAQEELEKGDVGDAAMLLRRALDAQPDDPKAQALLVDIESGEHAERRRRIRRGVAFAIASLVGGLLLARAAWEAQAVATLREVHPSLLLLADGDPAGLLGAVQLAEQHAAVFPGSFAAGWDLEIAEALARRFVTTSRLDAAAPRWGKAPAAPLDASDTLALLGEALRPEGAPALAELVAAAEAAHGRGDRDGAWSGLAAGLARLHRARAALSLAGPDGRALRSLGEDQAELRRLAPRLHVLWARLSLRTSGARTALEAALEAAPELGIPASVSPVDAPPPGVGPATAGAGEGGKRG